MEDCAVGSEDVRGACKLGEKGPEEPCKDCVAMNQVELLLSQEAEGSEGGEFVKGYPPEEAIADERDPDNPEGTVGLDCELTREPAGYDLS